MEIDTCYCGQVPLHTIIKRFVPKNSFPAVIFRATDDLFSNKKALWAICDVLSDGGYVLVSAPLTNFDKVIPAFRTCAPEYSVMIFAGDYRRADLEVSADGHWMIPDSTAPYFLAIPKGTSDISMAWMLSGPRDNVFLIGGDQHSGPVWKDPMVIKNLIDVVPVREPVLLVGDAIQVAGTIKGMCRYVVGVANDPSLVPDDAGLHVVEVIE